ncbi:MAG: hypothetical protein Q9160_005746 [Pyrenula sp. 1 TL-2023]
MAALHDALKSLSPVSFNDVPPSTSERDNYVEDLFKQAQLIVESIPPPPIDPKAPIKARSVPASNASEISPSAYRSAAPIPEYAALQKEWGKPVSISSKDNPLAIPVYKLSAKDKKGAWFARRSVHDGLGFARWKKGLEREFPESTIIQGLPGEGNIRGIGGEKRVENVSVLGGTAKMEVYHLSAQFPGPTTPRDFVTFLVTSSSALQDMNSEGRSERQPRHYMIISKPCEHPVTPATDALIRGKYESVEFIREVPRRPRKSRSSIDLRSLAADVPPFDRGATMGSPEQKANSSTSKLLNKDTDGSGESKLDVAAKSAADDDFVRRRSRSRGRGATISFAESRGRLAKGEALDNPSFEDDPENNPVEWIMITRSDPGGNIPRFMIERGTPGSIVADAVKFLDWACQKEHPETDPLDEVEEQSDQLDRQTTFESWQTNGHLAGLAEEEERTELAVHEKQAPLLASQEESLTSPGVLGGISSVVSSYAPTVREYLPAQISQNVASSQDATADNDAASTISGTSFASADSHLHDREESNASISSKTSPSKDEPKQLSQHEKELEKLAAQRKALDDRLIAARDKSNKDAEVQIAKEQETIRKAEERHNREIKKQEEKHRKEIDKLERKRSRERKKTEDRRKKQADKDEKTKLTRERDEARAEIDVLKREREIWQKQVGELQQQNTRLIALLGSGGPRGSQDSVVSTKSTESPALPITPSKDAIRHLIEEERGQGRLRGASFGSGGASSGNRSRSGSLKRGDH